MLDAIGAGQREHKSIASTSGIGGSSLERALEILITKQVVSRSTPYSTEPGGRRSRYQVTNPYLRFWLRYLGPSLPEIERGRGRMVAGRVIADFSTFAGQSIEPVIREALTRTLPDRRLGRARNVGGYWTRDGRIEADLVGGRRMRNGRNASIAARRPAGALGRRPATGFVVRASLPAAGSTRPGPEWRDQPG